MKGFSRGFVGKGIGRRSALRLGLAGLAGIVANPALAAFENVRERKLALHNLHTGETSRTTFWADGVFQIDALRDIDFVLRDYRTGEVEEIDPQLLVLLHKISQTTGKNDPFDVISGYRSPKTNATLASKSSGVAKRSLHMQGMAIDIRLPSVRLAHLRDAAKSIKTGGVGYYPKSNFIHVDTGRVRYW
jgi:uncharacterized protein YcbK (DUF882 family)